MLLDATFLYDDLTGVGYRLYDSAGAWLGARVTSGIVQAPGDGAHWFAEVDTTGAAGIHWDATSNAQAFLSYLLPAESSLTAAAVVSALFATADTVETGVGFQSFCRAMLATKAGVASGGGSGALLFKNPAGTADRVGMLVDENGNRSTVTLY